LIDKWDDTLVVTDSFKVLCRVACFHYNSKLQVSQACLTRIWANGKGQQLSDQSRKTFDVKEVKKYVNQISEQ